MAEPEMTNDQYHDLLDAVKEAQRDFRYVNVDKSGSRFEVEAYQITGRSRFDDDEWPVWMVKQKGPSQVNAVYCDAADPNMLVLKQANGIEQPLGTTDWLVFYANGEISAVPDTNFQHFDKVVPVPDRPIPPEMLPDFEKKFELDENNKLIPRKTPLAKDKPVPGIDNLSDPEGLVQAIVSTDAEELTEAVTKAMAMLQADKPGEALDFLKEGMMLRVNWCNCRPGQCEESEVMGCRVESPLVK